MNRDAVIATRDAIAATHAANKGQFAQDRWSHSCGSPGCVAGFCVVEHGWLIVPDSDDPEIVGLCFKPGTTEPGAAGRRKVSEVAAELMELDDSQADQMFSADPYARYTPHGIEQGSTATAEEALGMLDRFLETGGLVEWPGATRTDGDEGIEK